MKTHSKNTIRQAFTSDLYHPAEPAGYFEKRGEARIARQSRVKIKELKTGNFYSARMRHCSKNGIYVETDSLLLPGTEIYIGIENSPFVSFPNVYDIYRAEVKWLRMLNSAAHKYGCGIKFNLTTSTSK
jgi:Tfp pilus assembly protein PilZ